MNEPLCYNDECALPLHHPGYHQYPEVFAGPGPRRVGRNTPTPRWVRLLSVTIRRIRRWAGWAVPPAPVRRPRRPPAASGAHRPV